MKKMRKVRIGLPALAGAMTLLFMLALAFFWEPFSMVSHAESKAKVTAGSANIRKAPNASSEILGSTEKDKEISIKSQTTGSDGAVWYQVYVNADTLGYIRSDLVSITDGTTPPTEAAPPSGNGAGTNAGNNTGTNTTPPPAEETPAEVTALQPLSATTTGGQSIRVRANASTTSQIVKAVKEGLALTVTGQAAGADGKVWYQVTFIDNGAEVTGFIRSDYVALSGEPVPMTETPPAEPEPPTEPEPPAEVKKDWDTQLQGDTWYLVNNVEATQYAIDKIFAASEQNIAALNAEMKTVKGQRIAIIILVILVVLLGGGLAFVFFKIKDSQDSAYFSQVERETLRRKADNQRGPGGQRVMHTVGGKPSGQSGAAKPGARPSGMPGQAGKAAGRPSAPNQSRPAGASGQAGRPVGTAGAGVRPEGAQRPAGRPSAPNQSRPAGVAGQAGRPVGTAGAGVRPEGAQRPAGRPSVPNQSRPAGAQGQTVRPSAPAPSKAGQPNPGWKSKNFMSDDDEFEFEFLNWDGDEES